MAQLRIEVDNTQQFNYPGWFQAWHFIYGNQPLCGCPNGPINVTTHCKIPQHSQGQDAASEPVHPVRKSITAMNTRPASVNKHSLWNETERNWVGNPGWILSQAHFRPRQTRSFRVWVRRKWHNQIKNQMWKPWQLVLALKHNCPCGVLVSSVQSLAPGCLEI